MHLGGESLLQAAPSGCRNEYSRFGAFKVRLAITSSTFTKLVWIDVWTRLASFYLQKLEEPAAGDLFAQTNRLTLEPRLGI